MRSASSHPGAGGGVAAEEVGAAVPVPGDSMDSPSLRGDPSGPESGSERSGGDTSLEYEEEDKQLLFPVLKPSSLGSSAGLGAVGGKERAWRALEYLLRQGERQRWFNEWRMCSNRQKATTLALWAVDQGNRKAYEVERALMADNSWATSSIIWQGYSESPFTCLTPSGSFWAAAEAGEEDSARTAEAIKVTRQQNEMLRIQVQAARQQLAEWQDIADFQTVENGSWKSMQIQSLKRQMQVMKRDFKAARAVSSRAAAHRPPAHESAVGDGAGEDATPRSTGEAASEAESERAAARSLSTDMRHWMMGYESRREIHSTIPGLGPHPVAPEEDLSLDAAALERQAQEEEEEFGPCIDDLTLLEATMQAHDLGASSGLGAGETARVRLTQMLLDHASEQAVCRRGMLEGRFSADFALAAQERHYAELRTLCTSLGERLASALTRAEQAEEEKSEAMGMVEEARAEAARATAEASAVSPGEAGAREEALLRELESVNAQLRDKSMLVDHAVCGVEYVL